MNYVYTKREHGLSPHSPSDCYRFINNCLTTSKVAPDPNTAEIITSKLT